MVLRDDAIAVFVLAGTAYEQRERSSFVAELDLPMTEAIRQYREALRAAAP